MAAWIVREEIDAIDLKAYANKAEELLAHLAEEIGHFYKTRCPVTGRKNADVKYFLWVKTGTCAACQKVSRVCRFPYSAAADDHPNPGRRSRHRHAARARSRRRKAGPGHHESTAAFARRFALVVWLFIIPFALAMLALEELRKWLVRVRPSRPTTALIHE